MTKPLSQKTSQRLWLVLARIPLTPDRKIPIAKIPARRAVRILLLTRLYPLPDNPARGTFVADHVSLLRDLGHDVEVVNVLPKMFRFQEARRSTMFGVAKVTKNFIHDNHSISVLKHWEFPDWPSFTTRSVKRLAKKFDKPDVIISHTLWPVAELANSLSSKFGIPWIGIVHGYDFDVALESKLLGKRVEQLAKAATRLVVVSDRLSRFNSITIPCHVPVEEEWLRPLKQFNGNHRRSKLDILFPADPRRPEKNHLLALRTGEEMEKRGWSVGITVLMRQPRSIVWDRMLSADVTLITSKREGGPLVAKESVICGTPVVAVDVGDLSEWMDVHDADPAILSDAIESTLKNSNQEVPVRFSRESVMESWRDLLEEIIED